MKVDGRQVTTELGHLEDYRIRKGKQILLNVNHGKGTVNAGKLWERKDKT